MTYKGAIDEVKSLSQNPMMPDIFKPSLNKIAETLEMEKDTELCDDVISRQAVLDSLHNKFADGFDSDRWWNSMSVLYVINKVPPVQPIRPKGKWIPVSERLPEERDWYLGIFKERDTEWINPIPFICDYVGSKTKATTKDYWILRGFTDGDELLDYYYNLECVVWMPLPEPYKEGEKE